MESSTAVCHVVVAAALVDEIARARVGWSGE